jgi:hypothetical protein
MKIFLSLFFWLFTISSVFALSELNFKAEEKFADILTNTNFLLFRRGERRKIIPSEQTDRENMSQLYGTAKFDPASYFKIKNDADKLKARNLTKAFIRTAYNNDYSHIEALTEGSYEAPETIIPVLHFTGGEKNHYLLKRIDDQVFDLIVFEYSAQFDHYSKKVISNYELFSYLLFACISQNKVIRISLYREQAYELPMPTNLEIPVKHIPISELLTKIKQIDSFSTDNIGSTLLSPKTPEDMLMILSALEEQKKNQNQQELLRMKELINVRLPRLDLSHIKSINELNLTIQSEIIRKIFNPEPVVENCPGVIEKQGYCRPNGIWDEKTWGLYRRLYRIEDIAGAVFHEPKISFKENH